MSAPYAAVVDTPVGRLGVRLAGACVVELDFLDGAGEPACGADAGVLLVAEQIRAYLRDCRFRFQVPLAPAGTVIQQKVWQALGEIPAGRVTTYGELARRLGSGARAVGNACRANPIPLLIPCHRVVAADGLGGYAGASGGERLARKRWLLRHEGALGGDEIAGIVK